MASAAQFRDWKRIHGITYYCFGCGWWEAGVEVDDTTFVPDYELLPLKHPLLQQPKNHEDKRRPRHDPGE